jgi:hypothetical protein
VGSIILDVFRSGQAAQLMEIWDVSGEKLEWSILTG